MSNRKTGDFLTDVYSNIKCDSSGQKSESFWETNAWWLTFCSILVLNIVTRFYNVHLPKWVCWDETHFGKMGSWYINQG